MAATSALTDSVEPVVRLYNTSGASVMLDRMFGPAVDCVPPGSMPMMAWMVSSAGWHSGPRVILTSVLTSTDSTNCSVLGASLRPGVWNRHLRTETTHECWWVSRLLCSTPAKVDISQCVYFGQNACARAVLRRGTTSPMV